MCRNPMRAENWPGWRGPQQNGLSSEIDIPLTWSDTENIHWKTTIPGEGHSSPIVWGDAIFITTAQTGDLTRRVLRIDRETGTVIWNCIVATGPAEIMHRDNSSASSTPVTDGKFVYASFCVDGNVIVVALTIDGEVAWRCSPGAFASEHGYCTGMVLDENRLLLSGLQDGEDAFVAALNISTGATLWKVKRQHQVRSFSTPYLCNIDRQPAMLLSGAKQTVAYHRKTGEVLFSLDGPASKTVSSIVSCPQSELAYVCGGRDNQLFAINLSDAPRTSSTGFESDLNQRIAWRATKGVPYMNSPFVCHGFLHVLSDEGVYRCYQAATGEILNERRAVGAVKASMVGTNDRIYITEVSGRTTVIANSASWTVLATNDLLGEVVASPAISNGDIILRTKSQLVLIRSSQSAR